MRKTCLFLWLLTAGAVLACGGCGSIEGPSFPLIQSPRVIITTPASPASADITVSFQLIDRELESADILVQYSADGGQTFRSATLTNPADAANLGSGWYPGTVHTVQWDSVTDMVGRSGDVQVYIRITPSDASNPAGDPVVSGTFTVNNLAYNEPPTATVSTPAGVQSGGIRINYFLADVEGDICSTVVHYSTDNGSTYHVATMGPAGDGRSGLASSPSGSAHLFLWDSRADGVAPAGQQNIIKIRITPTDFNQGTAGETNSFSVDNSVPNSSPTVNITSGPANGSTVDTDQVTFGWSGSDTDGFVAGYYYSFDHDPPDTWTTNTSVTSGVLSESSHTFRVVAVDDEGAFSTVASRTFTVSIKMIEADFTASRTSGAAPLAVNFTDFSTSTSGIMLWSWSFGDGGTSNAQDPQHTYYSEGTYNVTLTVSGPDGSDTKTRAGYITVSPGAPVGTDWNTLGKNNQHTAYSPDEELTFPLYLVWEKVHAGGLKRPCGEQGVIFYQETGAVANRKLHALRLSDGNVNWTHAFPDLHYSSPPAVFNGKLYFEEIDDGSDYELVYCVSASSGSIQWQARWSAQWSVHEAPCLEGNSLYIGGGSYGGLYSFNVANGTQNWFEDLPQRDPIAPCLWNGVAYVHFPTDNPGDIYAVRLSDGFPLPCLDDGGESYNSTPIPCVVSEDILVASDPLCALQVSTGTGKWATSHWCSKPPAVGGGYVYAASRSTNALIKINLQTGQEQWVFPIGAYATGQPVLTKHHVIVPTGSYTCFVNIHLGTEDWRCDYGGEVIAVNGYIVITNSSSRTIWCLKGSDVPPPVTTANPPGGTYSVPVDVTLQSDRTATIYYTTDGADPTTTSYTGYGQSPVTGIHIAADTSLRFFAMDSDSNKEPTKTQEYIITGGALAVSTDSLPDGATGISYDATLLAVGGTTPYIWDITSGSLPSGLILTTPTGVISGIPSSRQTRSFTVLVTDNIGTTETRNLSIRIEYALADFSAEPAAGPAPLVVQFTDESTGLVTAWSWNFGDGGTSTQQNPSHTYSLPDTYTVSLTATTSSGSNSVTRANCIAAEGGPRVEIVNAPPATTFDSTPTFMYEAGIFGDTIVGFWVGIDASPPTIQTTGQYWTAPTLTDNQHTFYVQAESSDGSKSNIASFTFTVDSSSAPSPTTDWHTLGKNNQHTAHSPDEDLTLPLSLVWEKLHAGGLKRPCGEQGVIFYQETGAVANRKLHAVRLSDGNANWTRAFPDLHYCSPPAVYNDKLYFEEIDDSSNNELVYCVFASSGSVLWQARWYAQWSVHEAPCLEGANLYIGGGSYGGMYSFGISDGTQNWFADLPQRDPIAPCLWNGVAYVHFPTDNPGDIYAVRLSDGLLLPGLDDGGASYTSTPIPCVISEGILVTSDPLSALQVSTGTPRWAKAYRCFKPPAIGEGYVYAVSVTDDTLTKIDLNTGAEGWSFPLADYATGQPVVTKNHVIVPTADLTYFINIQTGAQDWTCSYGGEVITINGYVVICDNSNKYIRCLK